MLRNLKELVYERYEVFIYIYMYIYLFTLNNYNIHSHQCHHIIESSHTKYSLSSHNKNDT